MNYNRNPFKSFLLLSTLVGVILSNIHIISPKSLKSAIKKNGRSEGFIPYTVSTFGLFDYQAKIDLELRLWNTE